jgi:hypothetical protein
MGREGNVDVARIEALLAGGARMDFDRIAIVVFGRDRSNRQKQTRRHSMTENASRFVHAFNQIERHLRQLTGRDANCRFPDLLRAASENNAVVFWYKDEILQYGRLRNAIVHEQGTESIYMADPRDSACSRIEELRERILSPKTLRTISPHVPLRIFTSTNSVSDALAYMKANDFSQVIALNDGSYIILSAEGIAHWLGSKENMVMLREIFLAEIARFEPEDTYRYMSADDTIERALDVFTNDLGKRVFSILATETGLPTEEPITIITPWDFVAGKLR